MSLVLEKNIWSHSDVCVQRPKLLEMVVVGFAGKIFLDIAD